MDFELKVVKKVRPYLTGKDAAPVAGLKGVPELGTLKS